jgi:hypothetical protein
VAVRRSGYGVSLAVFTLALLTIAGVVNYFAQRGELRLRVDATKTRAYSLSEQTTRLLAGLEGKWTIALIMVEEASDAAVLAQVREVMGRYRAAAPNIEIIFVDPADPASLADYESLLARLRDHESGTIAAYESALADGARAYADLRQFAGREAVQLERLAAALEAKDPVRAAAQPILGALALLAREGGAVTDAVDAARRVTDARPIPDDESARSILAAALTQWADELQEMAHRLTSWRDGGSAIAATYAGVAAPRYEETASRLLAAGDRLARLPALEIATIGAQLQRGEAAVIIGPGGAAVVPSSQLFPKLNVRVVGDGSVAFDRRFRGEQVISAAIRSLLVEQMPLVVLAHAEGRTMLRENDRHADLVGVASLLDANRFHVVEWNVVDAPRPVPKPGQPSAWVIVPPTRREGLDLGAGERALVRAAEDLLAEGQAVMLNVNPSLLPRYGQRDPWSDLARGFGVRVDTSEAIFEALPAGEGRMAQQPGFATESFGAGGPIGRAAHGQSASFVLPVAVRVEAPPAGTTTDVIAAADPEGLRWLEKDWARKMAAPEPAEPGTPFDVPVPVMVAAQRPSPAGRGAQRLVAVGSGGWMLSYVADVYATSGGRAVLTNPGNQELFFASVAWLAGMDDLIAPSPLSRQVARLAGIDRTASILWGLIAVIGVPLGFAMLGGVAFMTRR